MMTMATTRLRETKSGKTHHPVESLSRVYIQFHMTNFLRLITCPDCDVETSSQDKKVSETISSHLRTSVDQHIGRNRANQTSCAFRTPGSPPLLPSQDGGLISITNKLLGSSPPTLETFPPQFRRLLRMEICAKADASSW